MYVRLSTCARAELWIRFRRELDTSEIYAQPTQHKIYDHWAWGWTIPVKVAAVQELLEDKDTHYVPPRPFMQFFGKTDRVEQQVKELMRDLRLKDTDGREYGYTLGEFLDVLEAVGLHVILEEKAHDAAPA